MRNSLGKNNCYHLQVIGPYNLVSKFLKFKRNFMASKAYFTDKKWLGWERNPYSVTYCNPWQHQRGPRYLQGKSADRPGT